MARSPQQLERLRYVSCLFWVLNSRSADASKTPSMHSLLKLTNTPVFDFFLQTSLLGKLADKIACFKELFPAPTLLISQGTKERKNNFTFLPTFIASGIQ